MWEDYVPELMGISVAGANPSVPPEVGQLAWVSSLALLTGIPCSRQHSGPGPRFVALQSFCPTQMVSFNKNCARHYIAAWMPSTPYS